MIFDRNAVFAATKRTSQLLGIFFNQKRTHLGNKPPKKWANDGVKYGLVTYYPRFPNHQDPPITPTKLLMVHRIKLYKYNPWWHKRILDMYKLNDKDMDIAIVKNTPENCAMLWKIKHLIKVTPINLPENIPDDDSSATFLHENGDLFVTPRIDPAREKATQDFINNPKRFDRPSMNDQLRKRWMRGWAF